MPHNIALRYFQLNTLMENICMKHSGLAQGQLTDRGNEVLGVLGFALPVTAALPSTDVAMGAIDSVFAPTSFLDVLTRLSTATWVVQ